MTYYDILFSFFIYGFLGWCTEVAYAAFKQHSFINSGFLNGPICPIYGIGVTVEKNDRCRCFVATLCWESDLTLYYFYHSCYIS